MNKSRLLVFILIIYATCIAVGFLYELGSEELITPLLAKNSYRSDWHYKITSLLLQMALFCFANYISTYCNHKREIRIISKYFAIKFLANTILFFVLRYEYRDHQAEAIMWGIVFIGVCLEIFFYRSSSPGT